MEGESLRKTSGRGGRGPVSVPGNETRTTKEVSEEEWDGFSPQLREVEFMSRLAEKKKKNKKCDGRRITTEFFFQED